MKGTVFSVFLEMVEEKWDLGMVDGIISDAQDPNQGAYTGVNYYSHKLLVEMVVALQIRTQLPLRELLITFGQYLFPKLAELHSYIIADIPSSLDLLENIETVIHHEVKKLYPQAITPQFSCERLGENQLKMSYTSHRSMADLAEGLILGCADYFGDRYEINRLDTGQDGKSADFLLTKLN